jgi:WD40 repeat protein
MTKVSLGSGGQNTAISDNGQYLAYYSNSGDIMRYDHATQQNEMVVDSSFGYGNAVDISDDGKYIAYATSGPHFDDVFLYEYSTGNMQNLTNHPADSAINFIINGDIKIEQTDDSLLVGYTTNSNFFDNTSAYEIWLYDSAQGDQPTLIDLAISGSLGKNTFVRVSWLGSYPAGTTFRIYRNGSSPIPVDAAHRIASTPNRWYTDYAGFAGDWYVVTAVNPIGESAPSNQVQAHPYCHDC